MFVKYTYYLFYFFFISHISFLINSHSTRSGARCQACSLASLLACGPTLPFFYHLVMLRLWAMSLGSGSWPACTSITGPNFFQLAAITLSSPRSVSIWPALAFLIFSFIVFIILSGQAQRVYCLVNYSRLPPSSGLTPDPSGSVRSRAVMVILTIPMDQGSSLTPDPARPSPD